MQFDPKLDQIDKLWKMLKRTHDSDTHMRHVLRMAIREHLKLPGAFSFFSESSAHREIASIALSVETPEASEYLGRGFSESGMEVPDDDRRKALIHIARFGELEIVDELIAGERERSKVDRAWQADSVMAIQQGLEERGMVKPTPELLGWAQQLARALLDEREREGPPTWTELPHPDSPKTASPWILAAATMLQTEWRQPCCRVCEWAKRKQNNALAFCGAANFRRRKNCRSGFAGTAGFRIKKPHDRNRARLVSAKSGEELASAFPPRNDVCQEVTWDLSGSRKMNPVRLEIVDGDGGKAYRLARDHSDQRGRH